MLTLQIIASVVLLKSINGEDTGLHITGGEDIAPHEFPLMARVIVNGLLKCGSTILAPSWVLTAAQCVDEENVENYRIDYGSVEATSLSMLSTKVSKIIRHNDYKIIDDAYTMNNIALIKVEPEIKKSKHVDVVKLPEEGAAVPDFATGIALGWGRRIGDGSSANILQKVHLPVLNDQICRKKLEERFFEFNICAGTDESEVGKDICFGDVGGPLLVDSTQIGIASYAKSPCAQDDDYVTSFTKVSNFVDWITHEMAEN